MGCCCSSSELEERFINVENEKLEEEHELQLDSNCELEDVVIEPNVRLEDSISQAKKPTKANIGIYIEKHSVEEKIQVDSGIQTFSFESFF